ncbi:MAG: mobile mystery protein B [Deltaproteobacteria bacterium]|nr:MAG: mobile mystery protein B [Deltaproteobacteria bacterium]
MMYDLSAIEEGQTPLSPEEILQLKPKYLRTLADLNQFESTNIDKAIQNYLIKIRRINLSDISVLKKIHKDMFNQTWKWAGEFRKSDKNLGCEWYKIPEEMNKLCANFQYWENQKTYSPEEIAVRFHYKLVWIHPFANGNGRHARLVADIYLFQKSLPLLNWGSTLKDVNLQRKTYIEALRKADEGIFLPLIQFASGK